MNAEREQAALDEYFEQDDTNQDLAFQVTVALGSAAVLLPLTSAPPAVFITGMVLVLGGSALFTEIYSRRAHRKFLRLLHNRNMALQTRMEPVQW